LASKYKDEGLVIKICRQARVGRRDITMKFVNFAYQTVQQGKTEKKIEQKPKRKSQTINMEEFEYEETKKQIMAGRI